MEQLAKDHQRTKDSPRVTEFLLIRAQAILFELSIIGENIDTLIGEINRYAEKCGKPRVEIIKINPNDLSQMLFQNKVNASFGVPNPIGKSHAVKRLCLCCYLAVRWALYLGPT